VLVSGEIIRNNSALTYEVEKRLLDKIAYRVYKYTTTDQLSLLGILGFVFVAISYQFAKTNLNWLHIASLGIFLHWFGDSLDGRVAKLRDEPRPKFGHYLDHILDAISVVVILVGFQVAELSHTQFWLLTLVSILLLTTHIHLRTSVTREFNFTSSKIGPTELRLILIGMNLLLIFTGNPNITLLNFTFQLFDWIGLFALILSTSFLFIQIFKSVWGKEKIVD
jgi:archaetidylinositol phosphate synthase